MVTSMATTTVMEEHLQRLRLLEGVQLQPLLLLLEEVQLLQQLLLAGTSWH